MKKKQILLIIILSVITFVSVVYLAGLLYFRSHFLPGTKMNGVEVSFLNQQETQELLDLLPVKLLIKEKDREGKETISEELELFNGDGMVLQYMAQKADHYQNATLWFLSLFQEKQLPYLIVWNKSDLLNEVPDAKEHEIWVSATEGTNIWECNQYFLEVLLNQLAL